MPTENRSSNEQKMVSVPRELTREMLNGVCMHPDLARSLWSALLKNAPQPAAQHQGEPSTYKPGLYAVRHIDNWDGERDVVLTFAMLDADGKWTDKDTGAPLLTYRGDKVLRAWPLDCPDAPAERDDLPPFAQKVLKKLRRTQECFEDSQGTDIGRDWLDVLVRLGLLNRVQRSPALWEISDAGDALLEARAALERKP